MYELINYSEHGTIVDNIIYTLNPVTGMNGGYSKFGIHSSIQSSFASQSASVNNNSGISGANKGIKKQIDLIRGVPNWSFYRKSYTNR